MKKKSDSTTQGVSAVYPLRVQAIKQKGTPRAFYVYIPLPLAAALGMKSGDEVSWELLGRDELHLVRNPGTPVLAEVPARNVSAESATKK